MTTTISPMARQAACLSRRNLLILGGASATVLATSGLAAAQDAQLVMSTYVTKPIARLSELEAKTPVPFTYPTDAVDNLLIKLEERAGGGIGPDQDVVAFNVICPHQGGYMDASTYKGAHNLLGPCPLHLSTFDLTRHGLIASGHATASLPQIVLALDGDDIVATGVMGLFYGYNQNPTGA